jgi:DNA modification methylase
MTPRDKPKSRGSNKGTVSDTTGNSFTENKTYTEFYPKNIIDISNASQVDRLHPTQKPVALLEYLIKTYTLEGETVLDNTMGSGSTGIACINTKRNFIGIEKDDKYFEIAVDRIAEVREMKANEKGN